MISNAEEPKIFGSINMVVPHRESLLLGNMFLEIMKFIYKFANQKNADVTDNSQLPAS